MVEVLVDHRNGCRICRSDDPQGCVPYPPERTRAHFNSGYVVLRDALESVDWLHEVKQFPPLGPVLKAINSKRSPWETIGCGPGQFTRKGEQGKFYAGTYIHLVFACRPLNFIPSNHLAVALGFGESWKQVLGAGVDAIVEPLSDYWGRPDAWAIKFEIAGKGNSFTEAWSRAELGIQAFLNSLLAIDVGALLGEAQ